MTTYHGGKYKLGKKIADIIYEHTKKINYSPKGYVEPFSGMLGVYRHIVKQRAELNFIASDINRDVINMWKSLQTGWIPNPSAITREGYNKLKSSSPSPYRTMVGYHCSFGGIFYGSYSEFRSTPKKMANISKKLVSLSDTMKHVKFECHPYNIRTYHDYIIYCDPPYQNTQQRYTVKFDSENFWDWAREMSKNNIVFISEYTAPDDFVCIAEFKHSVNRGAKSTEKIFVYKRYA